VVPEALFCPEPGETRWYGLLNWTIQFGDHRELVLASILASVFTSRTLSCSAATSSGLFSVSGFASSFTKVSLLGPILPWLLPGSSVEDLSFNAPYSFLQPGAAAIFGEIEWSGLAFQTVQFSYHEAILSCCWSTYL
jgi:hypothetical protein